MNTTMNDEKNTTMNDEKNTIMSNEITPKHGEVVLYQTEDGKARIDVVLQDETVWLPIEQMSLLFGKSRSTINEHILNIYKEGELIENETMRKIGNSDFSTKPTNFYNLDVIIYHKR